ncbi:MAG TPA: thiamine pyrophosphate-dependent enzyme, partial [Candidatus Hydrogenedentes bacterium]|nr:thiamine pyrophosphate-dependent enzyme [Candidatus Hydrogenedentota bacterium]
PTLIECKTYRIRGHFEGDDSLYRTKEEVAEARKRDPIDYWKGKLLGDGVITEEVFTAINEEADAEVADAALFAEQSPFPAPEEALILTAQA